ncbi:MAG: AAA family ATPase [Candidatus Pacebacteria bacterium]|nr:AAA family ATPase [Candidatus Paceibacterota bacterium]
MKINSIKITSHGPIKNKEYQFTDGFNLIYGPNERGKSLTFDALIKMLLGKASKGLDQIDRVETQPGKLGSFVEIQTQDEIHKLQGQDDIAQLLNLEPDDCKNLFFIRNSDLSIGQDFQEQQEFYTNFTDRLTGLKTQQIKDIKQEIRDIAKITPKNDSFQNTAEANKLGERLDQAQALLAQDSQLSKILQSDQTRHWEELENRLFQAKHSLKETEKTIKRLEQARQKQEYLKLEQSLEKLETLNKKLEPLELLEQDQLDQWHQAEYKTKTAQQQIAEVEKRIAQEADKLKQSSQELEKIQTELIPLAQINQELDSRLSPQLVQLQNRLAAQKANRSQGWTSYGLIGGSILLTIALIGYILQPSPLLAGLALALLAPVMISAYSYWQAIRADLKLKTELEQVKLELNKHDIQGKQLEELLKQAQAVKQQYHSLKEKQAGLTTETKALQNDLSQLKDNKLPEFKNQLTKAKQEINQLKSTTKTKSPQELKEQLQVRLKLEKEIGQYQALIEDKLGKAPAGIGSSFSGFPSSNASQPAGSNLTQDIRFWKSKLEQQKLLTKTTDQLEYSPQKVAAAQQKKEELTKEIEQVQLEAEKLKTALNNLEKEVSQVLDQQQACQSIADLKQVRQELDEFIKLHQVNRENALTAIDLLEKIEQQDREKVEALFGQDSPISQLFSQITAQKYTQVFLDLDQHKIKVEQKDGQILNARSLSAGTYDQLYFAIRLGLAEKLLPTEKGFFVMDDPFLKSDETRLGQQLDMLMNFSNQGWQIIYLSAKKEVHDYLDLRQVNLIDLS